MAIKAVWAVEHSCGHDQEHYLGHKRPSARARFARWLATKDCTDCWRAKRAQTERQSRDTWLAERRAMQTTEIDAWETTNLMPRLDGSDKAVRWGSQVRHHHLLAAAHHQILGFADDDLPERLARSARTITSASWWIDQRDTPPEDVEELVTDAANAIRRATRSGLRRRAS